MFGNLVFIYIYTQYKVAIFRALAFEKVHRCRGFIVAYYEFYAGLSLERIVRETT